MTSQINYTSVNASYPVAGQDNDSQGFRDNFSAIKVALSTASNEITDLQLNTAKLNVDNDFGGNMISNAVVKNLNANVYINGSVDSTQVPVSINANQAGYHILGISTSTYFAVDFTTATNIAAGYCSVRVAITPSTSSTNIGVSFVPFNIDGYIRKESTLRFPWVSTYPSATSIWDIWTIDGGVNNYVKFVGTWT